MCSISANLRLTRRSSAGHSAFQGRSLLQSHLHVLCSETLGFQRRRSRVWIVPLSQRRRCFGRALRCSLSVQYMCESCRGLASQSHIGAYAAHQSAFLLSTGRFANEPGLGILCRMPTEDLRAGPKLALSLPIKAPSFQGPAGMILRSRQRDSDGFSNIAV